MTDTEVAEVLARLLAGYAGMRLEPENVAMWMEALGRLDHQAALTTVAQLVETNDRFPSISAFVSTCLAEQRRLAAVAGQQRERERGDTRGRPAPCVCEGTRFVLLTEGQQTDELAARVAAHTAFFGSPPAEPMVARWRDYATRELTPCPACDHATYHRWRAGHFDPGHTCAECSALRSAGPRRVDVLDALRSAAENCRCHEQLATF